MCFFLISITLSYCKLVYSFCLVLIGAVDSSSKVLRLASSNLLNQKYHLDLVIPKCLQVSEAFLLDLV